MNIYLFAENVKIALKSIKTNIVRTILTVFIIAFGIMALVGILTAIEGVKNTLTEQFSLMGANSFAIIKKEIQVKRQGRQERKKNTPNIKYEEAQRFKKLFRFPCIIAISAQVTSTATIKYKNEKTDPNINTWGVDENDIYTSGKIIEYGRNFTENDIVNGSHYTIIGSEIGKKLFKTNENPLNKVISLSGGKYKIIGILKEKGSSFGGWDRVCLIPITNSRQYFPVENQSYRINIMPLDPNTLQQAINEAEGLFRIIEI